MADVVERGIGALTVWIDRLLCVGFGDCIDEAPEAFVLADAGIVAFTEPERVERERLVKACAACPVDALTVVGADGGTLAP